MPNRRNLCQIFLCLSFFLSFLAHSISVSPVFLMCVSYMVCDCVCCFDLVIVDRMIIGLTGLPSPQRKTHLFKVTKSSQTHSLPSSNKVYYVRAVPYRSDDNHSGTMKAATEGTSESFGPPRCSEIQNSQTVAQLQSRTEASAHYPCKERGE